ncbi:MAG: RHS repeat-associated core domain-containing protein [Rhodocyclaceae bacterium]|nr:RHS repeat-associated core domain-containing protein [Rhodocyclaceae bacterium]MCA3029600.1 RHS repeat-associated core domain-containing protein [Rhodocyclaceae bacterium]MCA3034550.1 RHS repeat-associated core domain-containing protein [Rhodocyclaceae bacterium]MCA3083662.1 RHS repeat-associated core domain-containing protein [Rhodocyclaceae bacterium]
MGQAPILRIESFFANTTICFRTRLALTVQLNQGNFTRSLFSSGFRIIGKHNYEIVNNRGQTTIKSSVKKNGGLSPNIPNGNNVSGYTSLWKWDSLPFGDTLPNSNPSGLGVLNFNHRFPGQYYDKETGLYQNWNRDYDPSLGRYVQSDPWGLRAHPNTYTYVGAVPTIAIDPHGTDLVVIVGGQRQGSPNIFGHISVGVCGSGIYSFGTLTPYGSSISAFIVSQSTGNNPQNTIRDQTAYVIRTNVIQDALALASLREAANRSLGILADNCANRTQAALVAAGIPAPHSGTPGSVENSMRALVSAGSANSFSIPAGTTSLPAGICQN